MRSQINIVFGYAGPVNVITGVRSLSVSRKVDAVRRIIGVLVIHKIGVI
jgi:hypothetical protein